MGEIYASANWVLIWLGEASKETEEVFSLLPQCRQGLISGEVSQKLFSFHMELVERDLFSRLWTIQELVLAEMPPFVGCGHSWTTWGKLTWVWRRVSTIEFRKMGMVVFEEGDAVGPITIKLDLLSHTRLSFPSQIGDQPRDLLLNTISSNATEPRDRIYGLIGMLNKEAQQCITVDYNRPLRLVFAEAVAHIFQRGRGAFLISGMELAGPALLILRFLHGFQNSEAVRFSFQPSTIHRELVFQDLAMMPSTEKLLLI